MTVHTLSDVCCPLLEPRCAKEPAFNFLQGLACLQILLTFVAAMVFIKTENQTEEVAYDGFGGLLIALNVRRLLQPPIRRPADHLSARS